MLAALTDTPQTVAQLEEATGLPAGHLEHPVKAQAQQPFQQVRNRFLSAAPLPQPLEKLRRMLKKLKE